MEDRYRKISCITSADIAPPILLRRRLSAPETIMRKHTLAQQRSSSQESDRSRNSESTQSCPLEGGSDPNLAKKRDIDIRKSMLIKRFWEGSKLLPFPRTYSEWQYSFGKLKFPSPQSTPEHLRGSRRSIFDSSPKHRRISPKHDRKSSTMSMSTTKPTEDNEEYLAYSSNFSNVTSTESTTPTVTNSDSAYTNSYSSAAQPAVEETETFNTYQVNSNNIHQVGSTRLTELPIKYQFVIREHSTESNKYEFVKEKTESSTQTGETTNLNVISNVHLSESTLNLIFNQVMQDLFQSKSNSPEQPEPKLINVQNLPTFSLPPSDNSKQPKKSMISEINVGSPYRSKETPPVPRLSAIPRSTSMEVNISSNDSFDKESDSGSLVDSLEESLSPKDGKSNHDDKLVRGELSLLPDNSPSVSSKIMEVKKSSVFYIPMKKENMALIEEEPKTNDVSSLLPSRLKEKLMKRQLKREEKRKENKQKSFMPETGAQNYFTSTPDIPKPKPKKKKSILPAIDNKKEGKGNLTHRVTQPKTKSFWLPKTRQKNKNPASTANKVVKEEDPMEPKEIEILEIMEIVEPEKLLSITPKIKSKIPVLVQKSSPTPQKPIKPTYLDFDSPQSDPKLDQLIANILIDSLNREDLAKTFSDAQIETEARNMNRDRLIGKHVTIPADRFINPDTANNNPPIIEKMTQQVLENNNLSHGKDKLDHSKIPKGWITFYMLQKNNSPESTSDEGPNAMATKVPKNSQHYAKAKKIRAKDSDYKSEDYFESDWESEPKYKQRRTKQDKARNNGWSVTVSGTTSGQPGPDLEMRLKFPQLNNNNNNHQNNNRVANRAEVGVQKGMFPPLSNNKKSKKQTDSGFSFQDVCPSKMTSEITKSKEYLRDCDTAIRQSSVIPAKFEPRPTKTSKQRCMMNRPMNRHYHDIITPIDSRNRNLHQILDKFPDILSVNGSAVCRERRNMSKLTERDLKRILAHFTNNQD